MPIKKKLKNENALMRHFCPRLVLAVLHLFTSYLWRNEHGQLGKKEIYFLLHFHWFVVLLFLLSFSLFFICIFLRFSISHSLYNLWYYQIPESCLRCQNLCKVFLNMSPFSFNNWLGIIFSPRLKLFWKFTRMLQF